MLVAAEVGRWTVVEANTLLGVGIREMAVMVSKCHWRGEPKNDFDIYDRHRSLGCWCL